MHRWAAVSLTLFLGRFVAVSILLINNFVFVNNLLSDKNLGFGFAWFGSHSSPDALLQSLETMDSTVTSAGLYSDMSEVGLNRDFEAS